MYKSNFLLKIPKMSPYIFTFMKLLFNLPGKLFYSAFSLAFVLLSIGITVGNSQDIPEKKIDWTLPFTACPTKITNENDVTRIASDNGESIYIMSSTGFLKSIEFSTNLPSWGIDLGSELVSNLEINNKALFVVSKSEMNSKIVTVRAISKLTGITIWRSELPFSGNLFLKKKDSHLMAFSDNFVASINSDDGSIQSLADGEIDFSNLPDDLSDDPEHRLLPLNGEINSELFQNDGISHEAISEISSMDDSLIVGDVNGSLISYDRSSGKRLWSTKAGGKITSINRLEGQFVLVGSLDNFLYMFSSKSGNLKWKRRLPYRITEHPFIYDQIAVIGNRGNDKVYFVSLESGKILNQINLPDSGYLTANLLMLHDKLILPTTRGLYIYSQKPCNN